MNLFRIISTILSLLILSACSAIKIVELPTRSPSSDTNSSVPTATTNDCSKDAVDGFVSDIDGVMSEVNSLVEEIQGTDSPEEMEKIADELNKLWTETFLWQVPSCARDAHVDLLGVMNNLEAAIRAVAVFDMEDFERQYSTYELFLDSLNKDVEILLDQAE